MAFSTIVRRLRPLERGLSLLSGLALLLTALLAPTVARAQGGPNPGEPSTPSTPAPDRVLFLRGDQGVTLNGAEVTEWADQSGNDNDATSVLTSGPEFAPNALNGKPVLRFAPLTQEGEGLVVGNDDLINTSNQSERTVSIAFRTGGDVEDRQILYEEGAGGNGINVYVENGKVFASVWDSRWNSPAGGGQFSVSSGVAPNTAYVLTFVFEATAANPLQLFLNGSPAAQDSPSGITTDELRAHGGDITLGNTNDGTQVGGDDLSNGGVGFDGAIAEVVLANTAFNTAQRQIFESAVSEKYGIAVANDRYANANYEVDVIGVGQAGDGSKQTSDARGLLSVSTASLSNGTFGLLGHEGSNATFEGESDPAGIGERLSRVWRVDASSTEPALDLAIDVSGFSLGPNQEYRLLVGSGTGTFGSGATVVDGSVSSGTFTVDASALPSSLDGRYVTLAKTSGDVTAPSGLSYNPDPLAVAKSEVSTATATASFGTSGQPAPSFTVTEVRQGLAGNASPTPASPALPDGITLEGDGDVTVDPTAPVQGRFEIDVEASNASAGGGSTSATLVVEVTKAVSIEYTSQTDAVTPDGAFPSVSVSPTDPNIDDGPLTYTVAEGRLPAGLSLNPDNGEVTGTPTQTGRSRAVVEVSGSGMATGTARDTLNLSVLGGGGPGGVGNDASDGDAEGAVILDLNASTLAASDGDDVSTWTDASNYGNDATGGDATYDAGVPGLNDRPAVDFDVSGSTDPLDFNSDQFNNASPAPFHQRTISLAFQTGASIPSGSTPENIYAEGGGGNGISIYLRDGDLYVGMWSNRESWGPHFVSALNDDGASGEGTLGSIDPNTEYVVTLVFNGDAGRFSAYVNGTLIGRQASDVEALASHAEVVVGGRGTYDVDGGGETAYERFSGKIARVVAYDTALPNAQRQLLESGLGATYGVDVENARFDFAGTEEFAFGTDVVGFGKTPDSPNAHTPRSVSDLLTVRPSASLTDGDFTMIGTDGDRAVFGSEPDVTNFDGNNTDVGSRLARTWRVDATNQLAFGYSDLSVDVSGLDLLDGQTYVLLADSDPTFTGSATVVEGTVSGGTFTPDGTVHGSALSDNDYLTLARTVGDAIAPTNLTYDPGTIVIENGTVPDSTAAPSFDGGSPAPTFSIAGDSPTNPSAVSVDSETGVLRVDAETSEQGVFDVKVQAQNNDGSTSATVTVRIVEPATLDYDVPSQAAVVDAGTVNSIETIAPSDPGGSSINDGTVSYSVVEGSLGSLTLNGDGTITGTPSRTGLFRAVVQASGSDGAAGTATEEVNVAVLGADGPGGVGDAFADGAGEGAVIADFDADVLEADDGDELRAWADSSNYDNTVNIVTGTGPTYRVGSNTTGFNGRPAVDFSGTSDLLTMSDSEQFNSGGDPYVQRTVSAVFNTGTDLPGAQPEGIYGEGGGTRGLSIYLRDGDLYAGMWNDNEDDDTTPWGPVFFSAETDDGAAGEETVAIETNETYVVTLRYHFVESELAVYVNGTLIGKETENIGRFFDHGNAVVGGGENFLYDEGQTNYDEFNGQIARILVYGPALPDAQREILESALGVEYGISSLDTDLLADASFDREVVGAGQRADNPAPHDPLLTSDVITITPDVGGGGDLSVIGHDDSTNVFGPEYNFTDYRDDGQTTQDDEIDSRLDRTWRVAVAGNGAFDASDLAFDVSDFSLADGQVFALFVGEQKEFNPSNTKVVTGAVDTTATDTTFTPGTATKISDGKYVTLAKKLGDPAEPKNLSYPTIAVEAGPDTETAAPNFDGGQPLPTFSFVNPGSVPSGITIDDRSGSITVDASEAPQGVTTFDVQAENGVDSGEQTGADQTTVTVRVFERLESATLVRTLTGGETLSGATFTFAPALSGVADASVSYTIQRVNAFGTIQSDLGGTGLSFDASTGQLDGAPNQRGTVDVVVNAVGSGGAQGTVRARAKITRVGGTGLAGVGDATTTILDLSADVLAPSLSTDDAVNTWPDSSAYVNDAQASGAPVFKASALNGQPAVRFQNSGDQLDLPDSKSLSSTSPILHRAYTVAFRTGADVSGTRSIYDEQGGTRGYEIYIENGTLVAEARNEADDPLVDPANDALSSDADPTTPWENETSGDGIVAVESASDLDPNTAYVATLFHDYARGTIELWLNGEPQGSALGAGRQYAHTNGVISPGGFQGDVSALYATNASLNTTQRILLHNALAAKYGVNLSSGADDVYAGHESGNGDYDLGVFGIGQASAGDRHTAAQAGGLRFDAPGGLDVDDYLVAGHRAKVNSVRSSQVAASNATLEARFGRTWYVDTSDDQNADDLTVDVTFDLAKAGLVGPAGDKAGYVLLERSAESSSPPVNGGWTAISKANGLAKSVSGNRITFEDVNLTSGTELTLGTTDRAASPLNGGGLTIRGTAGTGEVDEGWRYLGLPVTNGTAADLQYPDGSQFLRFGIGMAYGWDLPSTSTTETWDALSSSTSLPNGRGFMVWIADESNFVPVDPSLTIAVPDALTGPGDTDVTVGEGGGTGLSTSETSHFLANPYAVPFDLSELGNPGSDDFQDQVFIWEPADASEYDESGNDDLLAGTYVSRSRTQGDEIAAWQGFFLERSNNSTATEITFDNAGRDASASPGLVGSKSQPSPEAMPRQIKLEASAYDADSNLVALDKAASVLFAPSARQGWDYYDSPKLEPRGETHVALGPIGTGKDGQTTIKTQESRSEPEGVVEIPLALETVGVTGQIAITAFEWDNVPAEWTVTLIDTKGTADLSDDKAKVLTRNDPAYTFDSGAESLQSKTAGPSKSAADARADDASGPAGPQGSAAASGGATTSRPDSLRSPGGRAGTSAPDGDRAPRPTFERMEWPRSPVASRSDRPATRGESPSPRFVLRIETDAQPLPVEMAGFEAKTDGENAVLMWNTASEKNNAGFDVQHQRLAEGDSTARPGAWETLGFVEGSGTVSSTQNYRYRTDALDYGTHLFRLRQVDTDGDTHYTDTYRTDVTLDEAYAVEAPAPNPTREAARLEVTVREEQTVTVEVYDVLGRRVAMPLREEMPAQQTKEVQLRADRLSSGSYFVRVTGEKFATTKRLTVVK